MNLGIGYESSDEEDVALVANPEVNHAYSPILDLVATNCRISQKAESNGKSSEVFAHPVSAGLQHLYSSDTPAAGAAPAGPSSRPLTELSAADGPVNGPVGPTIPPPPGTSDTAGDAPPGSPYTSSRSVIRTLTLPTVPDFDIPPSPPGSPPLQATKKFTQFLELKKKGQHFNQRLESSTVLRDPGHIQRLFDFAGIGEEAQYMSTLPRDVAVPTAFPDWAYVEELRVSQKKIAMALETKNASELRGSIDFVPATKSGTPSGSGPSQGKPARQSAAERVMAGLEKQSPAKRKDLEHCVGRTESSSKRYRSGSRSPTRGRSPSGTRK